MRIFKRDHCDSHLGRAIELDTAEIRRLKHCRSSAAQSGKACRTYGRRAAVASNVDFLPCLIQILEENIYTIYMTFELDTAKVRRLKRALDTAKVRRLKRA